MATGETKLKIIVDAQNNATAGLRSVSKELATTEKNASSLAGSLSAFKLASAAAAGASVALGLNIIKAGANFEQTQISFETMLGSAEQGTKTLDELSKFAASTPFELPQLEEASKRLLAYGTSADDLIPTLEMLGNISAGVGMDKMPQLILAFGQVKAATYLTGAELRQFTEAGVPLLGMLAKQSGKTASQIKEDMESGMRIPFEDVEKALGSMSGEGGMFFNLMGKQSQSVAGKWSNFKDQISLTSRALGSDLLPTLQPVLDKMIAIATEARNWKEHFEAAKKFIEDNGLVFSALAGVLTSIVIPSIVALTGAFVAMAGAALIAFGGAVLAAAPLMIAGAAIGGLAYLIISNWEGIKTFFSDLWSSIVDTTKGAFEWVSNTISTGWEAIKNVFVTVLNFIVGVFALFFDWLVPGWDVALVSLSQKAVAVWDTIKGYISAALDAISGVLSAWYGVIKEAWSDTWTTLKDTLSAVWDQITSVFTAARDVIISVMDEMIKPIEKVIDLAKEAMSLAGGVIGDGISNVLSRGSQLTGKAVGGPVNGGTPYLVGEKGPEIFKPATSGTIIPNNKIGGSGGSVNVYITGNTLLDENVAVQIGDMFMRRYQLTGIV